MLRRTVPGVLVATGVRRPQPSASRDGAVRAAAVRAAAVCRRGAVPATERASSARRAAVAAVATGRCGATGARRTCSPAAARATAVRPAAVVRAGVVRDSGTSTPLSMAEYRASWPGPGSSVRTSVVGAVIEVIAMSRVSLLVGVDRGRGGLRSGMRVTRGAPVVGSYGHSLEAA